MKQITQQGIKKLMSTQNLLGVHYEVYSEENPRLFKYVYKPMLHGFHIGLVDGAEGSEYLTTTVTINPLSQAQDDRITSMVEVLESRGFFTVVGHEEVNPIKTMLSAMEGDEIDYRKLVAVKKLKLSLSLANASVRTMTIAKQEVTLVQITETDENGDGQTLHLLFGHENNLHGLSTYINTEFSRADLRKFIELLHTGVLSVSPKLIRITTDEVTSSIVHIPTSTNEGLRISVDKVGHVLLSLVMEEGVINFLDKSSAVILLEENGTYSLRFYNKRTNQTKLEIFIK